MCDPLPQEVARRSNPAFERTAASALRPIGEASSQRGAGGPHDLLFRPPLDVHSRYPAVRQVNSRNKLAFVCIAIPALVEIGLGVVYFAAPELMPYHEEALGVGWSDLEPGVRTLLITLLNGYGSAHVAVGIALCALLLFPFRRGQVWARWAILAAGFPVLAGTAYLAARLAASTGAHVPWPGALVLLLLFIVGVALGGERQ